MICILIQLCHAPVIGVFTRIACRSVGRGILRVCTDIAFVVSIAEKGSVCAASVLDDNEIFCIGKFITIVFYLRQKCRSIKRHIDTFPAVLRNEIGTENLNVLRFVVSERRVYGVDKVFGGKLANILDELNRYLYDDGVNIV